MFLLQNDPNMLYRAE